MYLYTLASYLHDDSLPVKLVHWWPWQMVRRSDCRSCWKTKLDLRSATELSITFSTPHKVVLFHVANCCCWNFTRYEQPYIALQCNCSAYLILRWVLSAQNTDQVAFLLCIPINNQCYFTEACLAHVWSAINFTFHHQWLQFESKLSVASQLAAA